VLRWLYRSLSTWASCCHPGEIVRDETLEVRDLTKRHHGSYNNLYVSDELAAEPQYDVLVMRFARDISVTVNLPKANSNESCDRI
jgi:hypothetical protein